MEEGIQKLVAGQVQADVFFPDDRLHPPPRPDRPVAAAQPRAASPTWPTRGPCSPIRPWYDLGWNYTVPYVIYTTGVAYRRDRIDDAEAAAKGYEMYFDPAVKGAVSYYDSYRDAIGEMLLRNGVTDPDTGDPAAIDAAKQAILRPDPRAGSPPDDQRDLREAPGGGVHGLGGLVGRHRGRAVLPAEGHPRLDPRVLVSAGQEGADRQRHDRDPQDGSQPAPRARVPQLLPATRSGATRTSRSGTATSHRSRRSTRRG